MAVQLLKRHPFTAEEFNRTAEVGVISKGERLELTGGEMVAMAAVRSRHAACVDGLNDSLSQRVGGRALVGIQKPVHLDRFSEPQPDLALLRPRADFYARAHPRPADVSLAVEVADTCVGFDREVKVPLYARAGIPEAWLVDLTGDYIMACRKPTAQVYQDGQRLQRGQRLFPKAFPCQVLAAEDILGQP